MNAPAKIATLASPDYDHDGYGWAIAQAALMRAGAIDRLDWDNIVEEIESVGRSERRSLESALFQIALHMLKWDVQPARRGNSWWHSIENNRDAARKSLRKNPSLQPALDELVLEAIADARRRAARDTGVDARVFEQFDYDSFTIFDRVIERPTRPEDEAPSADRRRT